MFKSFAIFASVSKSQSAWVWIASVLVSVTLLGFVIYHLEWKTLLNLANSINWVMVTIAVLFLIAEGFVTAFRIQLFTGRKTQASQALKSNAWYSLMIIALPARLGEVAAIFIFKKYLGQSAGAAAMSIISQRVFDLVVLSSFFLMALIGSTQILPTGTFYLAGVFVCVSGLMFLYNLECFLTVFAGFFKSRSKTMRKLLKLVLQARVWVRHNFPRKQTAFAIFLTALKWCLNLGAVSVLIFAAKVDISVVASVFVAAAYNFLAVVPVQTFGGIGIGEAGLTVLLAGFGVPIALAAAVSIVMRIVLIIAPVLFWAVILLSTSNKSQEPRE